MRKKKSPLTPIAQTLRRISTDAERRLWMHLRDRRLSGAKFRRQFPIGSYVADFVCSEAMLIVELDGGQHALQTSADETRTKYLEQHGYRVLRFWNNDVLKETEGVLEVIKESLSASPGGPSPQPSPR